MPKLKTILLIFLPVAALVIGVLGNFWPDNDSFVWGHGVITLAILYYWFHLDATQRDYRASVFLKLSMVGLTIIALPYYLVRSRGAIQGMKSIGLSLLMLLATMTSYGIGSSLL